MFSLELGISVVAVSSIHQNSKKWQKLLGENDFEAVLVPFCCYDHDGKSSEAVEKITTDQNNNEKWLVTRILPT